MLTRILKKISARKIILSYSTYRMSAWEVSIMIFQGRLGKSFKVTRRIPSLGVAETKFFDSEEEAKRQFEAWLHDSGNL